MAFKEKVVAKKGDLMDGDMRQVSVESTDVLLIRHNDRFHALHPFCSHYGAPLAGGTFSDGRVVCPWHHACFDVASGYRVEPPGLDSLTAYEVRVEGEDVIVRVPDDAQGTRTPITAARDSNDTRTFAVLGGGAAGEFAAETLREAGFTGRILQISQESKAPYDRPNLSKDYLAGHAPDEWMILRSDAFYREHDIERMSKRTVTRVDARTRTLTFSDDTSLTCDGLILCTGGVPRTLGLPGENLRRVFTLRSYDDTKRIIKAAQGAASAVVIGASFIGMEVAASLRELGVDEVSVVGPEEVPFARVFGERIGRMVQAIHEENGVQFHLGRSPREFLGRGKVEHVVLDDDTEIPADLVVVGIGVTPATDFIDGVKKAADGSIMVDEYLRAADNVYAAGDIASFTYWRTGKSIRVEHWRSACQHGVVSARNLAGENKAYESIPFFWTAHFGTSIRYVGHAAGWDDVIYDGSPEERRFIAFFVEGGLVHAAAGLDRDREMAAIEELMRRNLMPSVDELRRGGVDYQAPLAT